MNATDYALPTDHREYRAAGHFTAAQIRELAPGPTDPRSLGCPESLFLSVLEKRSAFRTGLPAPRKVVPTVTKAEAIAIGRSIVAKHGRGTPPAPKVITDADRRAQAERIGKLIDDEKYEQWSSTRYAQ